MHTFLGVGQRSDRKGKTWSNTRELILEMLMEILEKGSYSHLVIRDVLDKYNYSDSRE